MVTNALSYHPLLLKQIENLNSDYFVDPSFVAFLERINKSYNRLEKDKQLSDHAFELTEKEYTSVNKDLVRQVKLRMESTQKLKDAIQLFDNEVSFDAEGQDDDILSIISYLKKQIEKSIDLEANLRKAKEEAETASIAKGDFLSVMSHEIRTPLNAVNGIIHLLLLDNPGPHQMENLKALDTSAENLLSLINDILDFSKMENGKILFNHRHFELRPFVENIKLTYNRCAQDKANTIELNIDPGIPGHIKGDDLRLRQILNNLVSNAIKFTKEGVVIVAVKLKEQDDHKITLRFEVRDTGIGIAKDKQKKIFERFAQADASTTREYGGTGLGLAISKKLLELQGSKILLDSTPGEGSTFYFDLAFDKETVIAEKPVETKILYNLEGVNILLVDDNSMNVLFTRKLIQHWNTKVDVAVNGVEAVERAKSNKYDLILMDLHMPVMDGYTASNHIRTFDMKTPILALTASIDAEVQEKIQQYGLNDVLQKPFKPNELYEIICKNLA